MQVYICLQLTLIKWLIIRSSTRHAVHMEVVVFVANMAGVYFAVYASSRPSGYLEAASNTDLLAKLASFFTILSNSIYISGAAGRPTRFMHS